MHLLNLEEDLRKMTGIEDLAIPYWNFAIGGGCDSICSSRRGLGDVIFILCFDWQVLNVIFARMNC